MNTMIKRIMSIYLAALALAPCFSYAANCPNGGSQCYKKAIFSRDIGGAERTMQERELDSVYVPNHHDFGVYKVIDGNIEDVECIGLFANSFSEAIQGAAAYLALLGLFKDVGWVDARVESSNGTRGPAGTSDYIEVGVYYNWLEHLSAEGGIVGPKPDGYHLIQFMCQDFASELY